MGVFGRMNHWDDCLNWVLVNESLINGITGHWCTMLSNVVHRLRHPAASSELVSKLKYNSDHVKL